MQNSRRGQGSVKWEWTGLWIWKWDVEVGMTSIRRLVFDVLDGGGTWQPTKRGAIRLQMGVQHGVIMKTREKKSSEHTKHGSLLGAKKKKEKKTKRKKGEGSHFQLWQIAGVSAAAIITYYSSSALTLNTLRWHFIC